LGILGVIDFGDAAYANRHFDFYGLSLTCPNLMFDVIRDYNKKSSTPVSIEVIDNIYRIASLLRLLRNSEKTKTNSLLKTIQEDVAAHYG